MKQARYLSRVGLVIVMCCVLATTWTTVLAQQAHPNSLQVLEKKVRRYIGWMQRRQNRKIWDAALRLEQLGKDAIPLIKKQISNLPEAAQVGCAKALIVLEELDVSFQVLFQVLEKGHDLQARIDAARLIGTAGDYDMEDALEKMLDNTFNPYLKIAVAKALWEVSRNLRASRELKSFLTSDDVRLRFAAALALAQIENIEAAKPVLAQIKEEPTARGELARALLARDALIKKYERLLSRRISRRSPPSKFPLIEEVLHKIRTLHIYGDKFTRNDLIEAGVKGMLARTDRHSAYWNKKEWQEYQREMKEEGYTGIGVYVGIRNNIFTVIAPIYSGPAYRAGIRSMDQILEVNGWPTAGKDVEVIVKRIKGMRGTSVRLKIYREGWAKVREIVVPRQHIHIPSAFYQSLPGHIGYVRLTQFGEKTADDMEKGLRAMEAHGMQGLIIDIRGNAGGWLRTVRNIVGKFLPPGKLIVYSKGRSQRVKRIDYRTTNPHPHPNYPIVVLVDHSSASASEILAGSLKYYKRAILVGLRTYGKGSIQQLLFLQSRNNEEVLKLTVARYFLPDGRSIHTETDKDGKIIKQGGIEPDIKIGYENWEPWKNEEKAKLEEKRCFQQYIRKYYSKHKKLFEQLADNDQRKPQLYPGFEEWYQGLHTRASRQDVRFMLRQKIRRRVADERGREYACDYLEDVMLQRAIVALCQRMGQAVAKIKAYQVFAQRFK